MNTHNKLTTPNARSLLAVLLAACPLIVFSQVAREADLGNCASIADDRKRLECFDRLAAGSRDRRDDLATGSRNKRDERGSGAATTVGVSPAPSESRSAAADDLSLAHHWELGQENKRGTFNFRPHRPNYLLFNYSDSPNDAPYRPLRRLVSGGTGLSHAEVVYQLGFKMKVIENTLDSPADVWLGYTQQSFWQAGNHDASSPFRETNYQPEIMAVMPLNFSLLGMHARFVNLGLVHQSNGQTGTLSRSWNRVYVQLGAEKGNFTLLARVWQRLNESASQDDNPDIVDYMGRGDLVGTYRWRGHEFSALARYSFSNQKGAVQLGWAFPIENRLKGYVQVFSGYGASLIDYNHSQKTLGLGILIDY